MDGLLEKLADDARSALARAGLRLEAEETDVGGSWDLAVVVPESAKLSVPAGCTLLCRPVSLPEDRVVGFDPADTSLLAEFEATYAVSTGSRIYGPYSGNLSNRGERIALPASAV